MDTKFRIQELQGLRDEFIFNESVYEDENPSWLEVAEAQAKAEKRWNETENGKELKAISGIKYLTTNETHSCRTHADAVEYLVGWLKANENKITEVSSKINTNGVEWYVKIHAHLIEEE